MDQSDQAILEGWPITVLICQPGKLRLKPGASVKKNSDGRRHAPIMVIHNKLSTQFAVS